MEGKEVMEKEGRGRGGRRERMRNGRRVGVGTEKED